MSLGGCGRCGCGRVSDCAWEVIKFLDCIGVGVCVKCQWQCSKIQTLIVKKVFVSVVFYVMICCLIGM